MTLPDYYRQQGATVVLDDVFAPIIAEAARAILKGGSITKANVTANEALIGRGIKAMSRSRFTRLLRHPGIAGLTKEGHRNASIEAPLLTPVEYAKLHTRLTPTGKLSKGKDGGAGLCSGLASCAICGKALTFKKKPPVYACAGRMTTLACKSSRIARTNLDRSVCCFLENRRLPLDFVIGDDDLAAWQRRARDVFSPGGIKVGPASVEFSLLDGRKFSRLRNKTSRFGTGAWLDEDDFVGISK
jgi:hypothetical protein